MILLFKFYTIIESVELLRQKGINIKSGDDVYYNDVYKGMCMLQKYHSHLHWIDYQYRSPRISESGIEWLEKVYFIRYNNLDKTNIPLALTSNIKAFSDYKLNYSSYVEDNEFSDNVALIALRVLLNAGVKEVSIAGFDGYNKDANDNYSESELTNIAFMQNSVVKNQQIKLQLSKIIKHIKINFITKSYYEI